MTPQDRAPFAQLMLGLGETYNEPVSEARMEIYFAALADLAIEDVRAAANAHVRGEKFFPRPAELRELIAGATEDRAELAWSAVVQLVRRFGYYQPPAPEQWPDQAMRRAAMELFGGWRALCERLAAVGSPEFLGTAKQFKALYAAQDRTARADRELSAGEAAAALSGIVSQLKARGLPTGSL